MDANYHKASFNVFALCQLSIIVISHSVNENRKGQQKGKVSCQNQLMVVFITIRAYLKFNFR